jgi:hypothetical protein
MADPETEEPLSGEAQAQDEQTLMPWIWGGIGLLVIAAFVAGTIFTGGHHTREPAAAAPIMKPAPRGL